MNRKTAEDYDRVALFEPHLRTKAYLLTIRFWTWVFYHTDWDVWWMPIRSKKRWQEVCDEYQ